jgi:hypothetical protein
MVQQLPTQSLAYLLFLRYSLALQVHFQSQVANLSKSSVQAVSETQYCRKDTDGMRKQG